MNVVKLIYRACESSKDVHIFRFLLFKKGRWHGPLWLFKKAADERRQVSLNTKRCHVGVCGYPSQTKVISESDQK